MTDIMTAVSTALTSVKAATEIAKLIKDADFSLEKAELNLKIAEIIGSLVDARIALADANDSVREKEGEIQKLNELLLFKEKLVRSNEAYYEINEEGRPSGAPYCQHCWEAKHLPIHLAFESRRFAKCPACKYEYQSDHVPIMEENA